MRASTDQKKGECGNCGKRGFTWVLHTEDEHEIRMCSTCGHVHNVVCPHLDTYVISPIVRVRPS